MTNLQYDIHCRYHMNGKVIVYHALLELGLCEAIILVKPIKKGTYHTSLNLHGSQGHNCMVILEEQGVPKVRAYLIWS